MSRNRIAITISGGLVTQVYSTLHPSELEVELLEFDAARRLSQEAAARLSQRLADVERTYRKLSVEVNIGLSDAAAQEIDPRDFEPSENMDAFRVAGWD